MVVCTRRENVSQRSSQPTLIPPSCTLYFSLRPVGQRPNQLGSYQRAREIAPRACAPPLTLRHAASHSQLAFQLTLSSPSKFKDFEEQLALASLRFFHLPQWRDLAQQQTSSLSSTYVQKSPRFATNTPSPLKMRKMILHAFKARSRA